MRQLFFIISCFLLCSVAACKKKVAVTPLENYKVTVIHENYNEAIQQAELQDKNICLMLHADWCSICKTFIKDNLTDESVENELKNKIIMALIDGDKDYGKTYFQHYKGTGFPTFLILSKNGVEIARHTGGLSKSEFLSWVGTYFK